MATRRKKRTDKDEIVPGDDPIVWGDSFQWWLDLVSGADVNDWKDSSLAFENPLVVAIRIHHEYPNCRVWCLSEPNATQHRSLCVLAALHSASAHYLAMVAESLGIDSSDIIKSTNFCAEVSPALDVEPWKPWPQHVLDHENVKPEAAALLRNGEAALGRLWAKASIENTIEIDDDIKAKELAVRMWNSGKHEWADIVEVVRDKFGFENTPDSLRVETGRYAKATGRQLRKGKPGMKKRTVPNK